MIFYLIISFHLSVITVFIHRNIDYGMHNVTMILEKKKYHTVVQYRIKGLIGHISPLDNQSHALLLNCCWILWKKAGAAASLPGPLPLRLALLLY